MEFVFLLVDENKNVVALYSDEAVAKVMKEPVENVFGVKLELVKRKVNVDIKMLELTK